VEETVPAWAHEPVRLHPHDPAWAQTAELECARLLELLGPWLVEGLEHVGSTAVPGLAAKPTIDLAASVHDPAATTAQAGPLLAGDGWCLVPPELDARPWRRFLVRPDPPGHRRLAHLHLIEAGHPRWAEQLEFRDALRRDPDLARSYEQWNQDAAERHSDDREAYTHAKAEFIEAVLHRRRGKPPERKDLRSPAPHS
jgi:GrpB-like predicted nucleotidyltransferase (UPF0157 family)